MINWTPSSIPQAGKSTCASCLMHFTRRRNERKPLTDHSDPTLTASTEFDAAPQGVVSSFYKRSLHENLLDSLEWGYALTVHKSQGSQWRCVVISLPTKAGSRSPIIECSLVYTALTRAQSEITVLGHHAHLAEAVGHRKAADRRKVDLPKRLAQMLSV